MLHIKQIDRYDLPRYPRGGQYVCPPRSSGAIARNSATLLMLGALLDSCGGWVPMGGMPIAPKCVSEERAREIIGNVFVARGIRLQADWTVAVPIGHADSLSLNADGFNDSLQVGYEYISSDDGPVFTNDARYWLNNLDHSASPHVLVLNEEVERAEALNHLQQMTEAFLDSLKVQGVI
jgi:hypothetical protein